MSDRPLGHISSRFTRCYEMQHEIDISECCNMRARAAEPLARPLVTERTQLAMHQRCYEMQHEIDISERRNMRAREARTAGSPARYGANPISGPCASDGKKSNTRT